MMADGPHAIEDIPLALGEPTQRVKHCMTHTTTDVAKPNPEKWQAYLGRTAHRAMSAAPIGGDRPCPTTGLLPDALGIWPYP